ncbi:Bacterial type II/III secretion system short domain protein [Novipirellula galeiformis]|uniref:Bacterial type II/III secretion system short domain protein n=1 Tax=Novipirellula galeiformis TaxID=2528004 RepID=A0A5C6CBS3_9BACT|nr:Bacterial type II/III secretion system short domain protein [Novipirellula galeiformis]
MVDSLRWHFYTLLATLFLLAAIPPSAAFADEASAKQGNPAAVTAGKRSPSSAAGKSPQEGQPQPSQPTDAKPSESAKPDSAATEAKVIRRDQIPENQARPEGAPTADMDSKNAGQPPLVFAANPDELKASVGEDGRVAFQFRNQPWVDLVQWLAEISDQPLDWLELPGDRVNLSSPGRYTVAETRDLFNRYLLARGYAILELDGGLTVAKTETINPAIVPRVTSEELMALLPHAFVRISLDVQWLSAEKLAEELKPMISSNGRITALSTTNRIEVMDAAINVQQVARLLREESDNASREALAPEFKLRYMPAEEAKRMLEQFLGVEKKAEVPMTPQQIQQMQQMQQRQGGAQPPAAKKVEVSIVANTRQNSVLIRAPDDRIAIAQEFLKRIDVPSNSLATLADVQSRVQVFRLASLDPEKLIEIIGEMNVLEPSTRIRVDKENGALIVSGSAADRFIINSLIERLDGSGRNFHVLQLRRLDAGDVAESINFLMGQKKEDDSGSSRRRYSYFGYGQPQEEEKKKDEFRVAANNSYRQVLLWANDIEMEQVQSLLIKLGELPPPGGSARKFRVIDASASPETLEYLRQLEKQWRQLSPNPLELPAAEQFKKPTESPASDPPSEDGAKPEKTLPDDDNDVVSSDEPKNNPFDPHRWTLVQSPTHPQPQPPSIHSREDFDRLFPETAAEKESLDPAKPPASIRIELDPSGNLVLMSSDTKALDQLEDLMLQVAPPTRSYHVFKIKHSSAYWMKLNLEDYFEDEEPEDNSDDMFSRWYWGGDDSSNKKEEPAGLGKGAKLKFVDDIDTNTLVVTGASPEQLRTIEELIQLWDTEVPTNKRKSRYTKLVTIQFGKADRIAETVKEAYRDLLSSNDKTFQGGKGQPGGRNQGADKQGVSKSRDGDGSGLVASEGGQEAGGADFSFKGKLSMGVDLVGNTLIVSAEGEPLLDLVCEMIAQLDQAAKPSGEVQVVKLSGDISVESVQNALRAFGAQENTPNGPQEKKNQGINE